jgi:hypothetical protein
MIEGPSSCRTALLLFMLGVATYGRGPAVQEENVPKGSVYVRVSQRGLKATVAMRWAVGNAAQECALRVGTDGESRYTMHSQSGTLHD